MFLRHSTICHHSPPLPKEKGYGCIRADSWVGMALGQAGRLGPLIFFISNNSN
jgi:hypothetical protein